MGINIQKIKGIILDVDGTLYYQFPVRMIMAIYLISANLFRPIYMLRIIRIIKIYRRQQEILRNYSACDTPLSEKQILMTVEVTGEPINFVQMVVDEWMNQKPLPLLKYFLRPGFRNFYRKLVDKGMKLGVYSDYPCNEKLEYMEIKDMFHSIVSSFDSDVMKFKPDSKGFLHCSSNLGLEPFEILYIGDRKGVDGAGALAAGMQVALIGGISRKKISDDIPRYRSFFIISEEIFKDGRSISDQ